jgi:hypothetical protein
MPVGAQVNWQRVQSMLQAMGSGGTVAVEQLQEAMGHQQLIPTAGGQNQLNEMIMKCDTNGDIDYRRFIAAAQQAEQRGAPIFM